MAGKNFGSHVMNKRVLILNQSYEPLTVCSPQKAMTLLYLFKADIVETYPNTYIRSVNQSFPLPSIIRLSRYVRYPFRNIEISRKNILKRDNHTCQYCGSKHNLTIDHILPKSRGGGDSWENLTTACVKCNNRKGNRTPSEANMKLMNNAQKPNYIVFLKSTLGQIEENWKQFLYY